MAITRGSIVGFEMKAYWDSASNATTPTWVEIARMQDLTVTNSKGQADVSRRESDWMLFAGGQKDLSLEFAYVYRPGNAGVDTVYDALQASHLNNIPMHLLIVDGATPPPSGSSIKGLELWGVVFEFGNDEPLSEGVMVNVTIKPTDAYDDTTLLVPKVYNETTP